MNRGSIYWVDLNPASSAESGAEINKLRPCVIIGATPINKARNTVVVVPLSTAPKARPPITISVTCLDKQVTAICDQIRSVDKKRLRKSAGHLSEKDLEALEDGLRQVLVL